MTLCLSAGVSGFDQYGDLFIRQFHSVLRCHFKDLCCGGEGFANTAPHTHVLHQIVVSGGVRCLHMRGESELSTPHPLKNTHIV